MIHAKWESGHDRVRRGPAGADPFSASGPFVAPRGEGLRRLVIQPAVRTHLVVLALEARRSRHGVGYGLKAGPVEELVSQPAVERLHESVLPRARRGDRRQFNALAWQ